MTAEVTRLANGLLVVTETMAHLETTSLGVWVAVGSRHERPKEHGLSHLLEHMAFKGTTRRTAADIAVEIEAMGGELNAATGVEATAYYARVLKGDEGTAFDIIADILKGSVFEDGELAKERDVILQEIAGALDSPDDIAYDLLHDAAYPGQAAGRPILGTPKSVKAIFAPDLKGFLSKHYSPSRMVIAAVGAVRHDEVLRHVEALFGGLIALDGVPEDPARYVGGVRVNARRFEQSHLLLGFRSPSYLDPGFFSAQVLSGLLGGGMSSRLFQEVREKRGLCYSVYSSAWGLKDTGMFAIHTASGAQQLDELSDVVIAELERLAADSPSEAEVARSKAQLKAGLLMSLESSSARAEQLARQLLFHGRVLEIAAIRDAVDRVTPDDVRATAAEIFASTPSLAIVGAGRSAAAIAERARARLAS
ncbi:MAG: pitrilysin family protein [Hyphomicrobium sp.]|nr:pitrilysin family protein [Hyphomicrobium sp.]